MAFGVTPVAVGPFPPAADDGFPNYIQFQNDGVDLGGPDADTLNFGSGLTATRGTGEQENVVSVTAAGGGGAAPALVVQLFALTQGVMNGALFSDWAGTPITASTDAEWSEADQAVRFLTTGVYRMQITARVDTGSGWPTDQTWVGSDIAEDVSVERTVYARHDGEFVAVESTVGWSDEFVVNVPAINQLIAPKVYGNAYVSAATLLNFRARVTVQRLGAAV